ncbi:L-fuculose phosphate aldolase [uncultured Roseburia sp.]|uniref:Class II aldolase/adducin family protein n=1 Tax=Brotonthovivens ammoniilytica TaxID=2981725 RepID=A0ABT2TLH3_9FIRM|nr:class II aldolase/adducin family protein [Brotonthovivens ammoniilytica]MCU6763060.1 class II aldolase/adducin family protein [Brotonthovivens ammoniilytica]SCJ01967.1 L-fuculose phosphate aldolase [uncultured Roseburia sp.]
MEESYRLIREQICDVCYKMWQRGIVAANDGNVSVKLEDGTFLCTPTGISKSMITPKMLVRTDIEGNVLEAADGYRPSSEMKMHFRCYMERPDVGAVVHAHPPAATTFAAAQMALDSYCVMENVVQTGAVPVAPYATPSTDEVAESVAPLLASHDAMLLARHGALTVGADLTAAYYKMESLEQYAKTTLYLKILGGAQDMDRDTIDTLIGLREKYGLKGKHPGYVKYNKHQGPEVF